ncbi:MAG: cytochrome c oxidase accessory protein CcoG [Verrucomicrobia bacterium]|nr:cytochrome c oxidase accessory protein CcoG [Verrucomicrobiota bacterium]
MPEETRNAEVRHESVEQQINWDDYRDHLATADQQGRRIWVYPKKPSGRFYRWRTWLSYLLLLVLAVGPFTKINGNPLLMFNIVERRFSIFGIILWPQDMFIFALFMLIVFIMVVLATAVYGRIFCGWFCPQTVMMEMVFRKIEYWIEGDHVEQRALNAAPWTPRKVRKKALKLVIFYVISFVVGNLLLAYIIGSDRLILIITDDPRNHIHGLTAMMLFSLLFFGIFARFREQACTFICPYGRFQSVLLDEASIIVGYDYKRGEKRGKKKRGQSEEERAAAGLGDCINCGMCVSVCPTGIDIRNGLQMECVHCTSCIDACDSIMDRIKKPRGLIRYASLNSIEKGEKLKATPRLFIYTTVLFLLTGLLGYLLLNRPPVDAYLLRAPGALYQTMPTGHLTNLYLLKLLNKTNAEMPVELKLENVEGKITVAGNTNVMPGKMSEPAVVVELAPEVLTAEKNPIEIGVYSNGRKLETVRTVFVGPEKARHAL